MLSLPKRVPNLRIVQLDVEVLVDRVQRTADGQIILQLYCHLHANRQRLQRQCTTAGQHHQHGRTGRHRGMAAAQQHHALTFFPTNVLKYE
jgi:hypothetical protein